MKPTWRVARNDIGCAAGGTVLEAGKGSGEDDVAGDWGRLHRGRLLRAVARNMTVDARRSPCAWCRVIFAVRKAALSRESLLRPTRKTFQSCSTMHFES